MSGKEFFVNRYRQLGWQFKEVESRQTIRINQTNSKGKNLPQRLKELGVELEKVPFLENGYWVGKSKVSAGATAEYLLGLYSIQEAAAQIPVTLFTNLKNKTVLDACAAPGGKTVQLADQMSNTGAIVALDINQNRLNALANHLERCHIRSVVIYDLDARKASRLNLKFDRILLDVPCFWKLRFRLRVVQSTHPQRRRAQCTSPKRNRSRCSKMLSRKWRNCLLNLFVGAGRKRTKYGLGRKKP